MGVDGVINTEWGNIVAGGASLYCRITDPIFLTFLAPLTLLVLSVTRSYSVRDGHHASLHLMVGSDLVMAVGAACTVALLKVLQQIQCLGAGKAVVANAVLTTATLVPAIFLLLMVCFRLERVAINDKRASLWRVLWNIFLGFLATALAVGVLSQQLMK